MKIYLKGGEGMKKNLFWVFKETKIVPMQKKQQFLIDFSFFFWMIAVACFRVVQSGSISSQSASRTDANTIF